jgi:hypothetical protein
MAKSQLTIDAGNDISVCADKFRKVDSIELLPLINGSKGFVKFCWKFKYDIGLGNYVYGSNILDDTTKQNPKIINASAIPNNKWIPIYLRVTDSVGSIASDSIQLRFSRFASLADFTDRTVAPNTNLQIYSLSGLGIPPLKYKWTPNYNIDDTSAKEPFVHPGITTTYTCVVTDSIGCKSTWYDQWNIYIDSSLTAIEEINQINAKIFPNPITNNSVLQFDNSITQEYYIDVFDILGNNIYHNALLGNTLFLSEMISNTGILFITISNKNQIVYKSKIVRANY